MTEQGMYQIEAPNGQTVELPPEAFTKLWKVIEEDKGATIGLSSKVYDNLREFHNSTVSSS